MTQDIARTGTDSSEHGAGEKLWFDYLSKLNDRELQTERASGATSWLLLAVLAAVAYRALTGLNRFVSTPHALTTAGTVGALLGDSLLHFCLALVGLLYYCHGKFEARLVPNLNSRTRSVFRSTQEVAYFALAGAHFVLSGSTAPAIPRKTLIAFALPWVGNAASSLLTRLHQKRRARAVGIPIVEFQGLTIPPVFGGLVIGAFGLAIGGLASACLYKNLAWLNSMSIDYAGPLRVAAQFWVSVILLFVLFNRQLVSLSRGIYLQLERDIVLKRLSVREIEQRFTEEALGEPVAKWLTEVRARLNAAHSKSNDIFSRIAVDLNEVEGIDRGYYLERQGRARKIEQKYQPEFKDVNHELQAISEQLNQFGKVSMSVKPSGELRVVLNEWKSDIGRIRAEFDKANASLVTRLSAIYDAAAGNSHP